MALDVHRSGITRKGREAKLTEEQELMRKIITPEHPIDPLQLIGERSFNEPREVPKEEIGTPVQEFYRNATIFLTGGTGFMGKVLLEKLLRSCPQIKHIYLLVRNKKGKSPHERLDDIFQDRLYKRLKHEVPKFYHKVSTVNGDLSLPGLGISAEDRKRLAEEVNIIFHGGATVRFDEKIDLAIQINVLGTREIIRLAKEVKNLKVVMYTSTAFSNCVRTEIEEKFYPIPVSYEDVIQKVISTEDKEQLDKITPDKMQQRIDVNVSKAVYLLEKTRDYFMSVRNDLKFRGIIMNWPNTYTFTKALAENLVQKEAQGLPFGILRPTVIISTYKEPVRGWIDNVYGPIGIFVGVGTGIIHVYEVDMDSGTDMVPVDLVVNCLICGAASTAENAKENAKIEGDIPIYTYSNSIQNPVTWRTMIEQSERHSHSWPTIRAIWYYSLTMTNNTLLFAVLSFLCHTIPGYFFDYLAVLTGKQPMLTKIYTKMSNVREILRYFSSRTFKFTNDNTQRLWSELSEEDKKLFFFNMGDMSWDYFNRAMCLGLRIFLVNDDIHTLPAARKKWKRLYYAHCTLRAVIYSLIAYVLWILINFVTKLFI